jgi:Cu2+-exporting ATPase
MSCCGSPSIAENAIAGSRAAMQKAREEELRHYGARQGDGSVRYIFSVPSIHCGACISAIEREMAGRQDVKSARVNLALKRLTLTMAQPDASPIGPLNRLGELGYEASPLDIGDYAEEIVRKQSSELLIAMAVAGFAAMNIMLLSVSNWSGAEGATRDLFHLVSAMIAIPTVAYSGRVFFRSAVGALRHHRLNMDVPISLAILLALFMSVSETMLGGEAVYFDASVSLLFFLLIGRYLDQRMREKARSAVSGLARIAAKSATLIEPSGARTFVPVDDLEAGMTVLVLPGERIPADGLVKQGSSDLDLSLVSGESVPVVHHPGRNVLAGTLNLTGPLEIQVTKKAGASFLAEISQMLEAAQNGRSNYVRLADRMARIYAPAVHLLSFLAFVYWMVVTWGDWHTSLQIAISVLIITCPCALGLAVPVVHVIGAVRLFGEGIMMKDGSGLERLSQINHVIFDKTGTLTTDQPEVTIAGKCSGKGAEIAASLARLSSHPASRAVAAYFEANPTIRLEKVREVPGMGMECFHDGKKCRLGNPDWVLEIARDTEMKSADILFAIEARSACGFILEEKLREGVPEALLSLRDRNMPVEILSGDSSGKVGAMARRLGISRWFGEQTPSDKIAHIDAIQRQGVKVLMVGDGLNDAPSLAAGHASMAPASASDIGRLAADFVFTRNRLDAVPFAMAIARQARRLVLQNFVLAAAYNCIAVPLAFAGFINPLFAAVAMSSSSIIVIANSMRLLRADRSRQKVAQVQTPEPSAPHDKLQRVTGILPVGSRS